VEDGRVRETRNTNYDATSGMYVHIFMAKQLLSVNIVVMFRCEVDMLRVRYLSNIGFVLVEIVI